MFDSSYVQEAGPPAQGMGATSPVSRRSGLCSAQNENTRLLVRALAGVGLVDGSVPVGDLFYRGWQARFTWAVGTGIERDISARFAFRGTVDYLRTKFVSSNLTVQPQNDIRVSGSLVFRFPTLLRREPRYSTRQR